MKSFNNVIKKFIIGVFCLLAFNNAFSQLMVEFRGDAMAAPDQCASGMIYEVKDQGCAPEDLQTYVKFGCAMVDAVKSKNLPFGWYGVAGDANSWYYIGDPIMMWATKWDKPNVDCPGGGGGGGPCPDGGQVGDTIYVSTSGDDGTGTGSSTCPYASLSAAISASSAGKVIKLATGTYAITSQITLGSSNDHQITITGGSSTATQTILRGSGSTRLIYGSSTTHSGPTEAWTWKNLTVENFTRTGSGDGVAFNVRYADGWTFSNVVFRNNGSTYSNVDGGVMYLMNIGGTAAPNYYWTFNDCLFDGNYIGGSGEDGGALRLYYAYVNFNRCIFTNNRSQDMGGAVFAHSKGVHNFYDCLFYKNWTYTDDGAGFAQNNDGNNSTVYCETKFVNCTFTKNTAGSGTNYSSTYNGGGGKGGAIWNNDTYNKVYLYNTIAYDNDGYSTNAEDVHRGNGYVYFYNSCIGSADAAGTGSAESTIQTAAPYNNLAENTDPLFNNAGSDDYSLSFSSPAKDAGCSSCANSVTPNSTDLAGNNRTGTYDIGSYEYQDCAASTPTITATETSGTTNNDGTICNGTSVTLSSSGYSSYSWSSGGSSSSENVSPTSNTTYTLNVVDGSNCIASNTRTITVNDPPTATITNNSGTTVLTCNISSIGVSASGGTTYSWDNSLGNNANATITAANTYTVTATTSGCTDTESITITSNTTPPSAGITNNTGTTELTCTITSISVTATGGTLYKWSNSLGNSAGASITSPGTYTATVYGANGCTDTESITITSNTTPPTASITNNTGTTILTCGTPTISLTASGGNSYSWDNSLGSSANATVSAANTYTVTATGTNGCEDTESITITSNTTPPTAAITNNTGTTVLTCNTTSVSVTATGGSSYSWSNSTNTADNTLSSATTYTVTATASNGCTDTETITITSNTTPPTVTANASSSAVCDGNSVTLTGGGASSYSWDNSVTDGQAFTPASTKTYTVTGTGSNGCTNTASTTVTVNANPTATITGDGSYCQGTTIPTWSATSSSAGSGSISSYSWQVSGTPFGTNSTFQPPMVGPYDLIITNSNGCTNSTSKTLSKNSNPSAGITNNTGTTTITCNTTSISVTATGGSSYLWSNSSTNASQTFSSAATYTVTVTDGNGCIDTEDITVASDNSPPTATITNNTGVTELTCSQTSISLTAGGGSSYSWSGSLGSSAGATVTSPGTYTVTATASNGCTNTESITITQDISTPTAAITNNTGTTTITCSTTSISVSATGGGTYSWNNSLGTSPNQTLSAANTYTVTVTKSNGCTANASVVISSNTTPPTATITNNSSTTELTCTQTSISLTGNGGNTFLWSGGSNAGWKTNTFTTPGTYTMTTTSTSNGCSASTNITLTQDIDVPTAVITNNTGTSELTCSQTSISLTASGGSSYSWDNSLGTNASQSITSPATYVVTATGSNGCTDTESITITQDISTPTASITNNDGTTVLTCSQTAISVTATGGGTYSWNNSLGTNATQSLTSAGTYNVTVTASNGCTDNTSVTLTSNTTAPTATITNNTGVTELTCSQTSISLTAGGGSSYSWDNSLGSNADATVTSPNTYTVTATGSNGCTDTESITITQDITNPTAGITNNDGTTELTCSQTAISVTATGGGTYSWDNSLGTNASQSLTSDGTYNVTVTASNGCTSSSSVTITEDVSTPTAGITNNTGSSTLTCATTSISVSATGGGTYSWSNSLGSSANQTLSSAATYTVTVTKPNGCTASSSITIGSNTTPPTATITNNTGTTELTCNTTTISLTGNGGNTFSWSGGSNTGWKTNTFTSPGTYTMTTTSSSNGCSASTNITLTQDISTPTASITNNDGTTVLTCSQTAISVTATGGGTYSWDNSLGTSASQSLTSAGSYNVTVTASNGCTDNTSLTLTSNTTTPTAVITNNDGVTELTCSQTSISLTASGGSSYSWDNSLGSNASQSVTSPATYTVTATGSNGCTDTESITISQDITNPTAGITNNTGTTELTCGTTSISLTATGGGTYSWNNSLGSNASATVSSPNTYTVTVTKSNGCTATESVTITQDISTPTATITNNTNTTELTCNTTTISLTAGGGSSYSWNNSLGTSANQSITTPNTYTVTATGSNGCTDTESVVITQDISKPTAGITNNTGSTELTCSQTSISLTATGGGTYLWSDNTTTAANTVSSAGTYTVTVTKSNGCTDTEAIIITQDAGVPTAVITNNTGTSQLTCTTTSISLTASGGATYVWSNGLGTSTNVSITSPGTYSVKITASNGCTDTESITISQDITNPTAGITNNTGSTELTCNTTSISVTATGGGTYAWSGSGTTADKTLTTSGTHTVTVTASNGCTATSSIVLTQDVTTPTATITNNTGTSQLTCTTTSISLTGGGGSSYSWSSGSSVAGETVTSPNTYTLTATGTNGCTDTESITITQDITNPTVTANTTASAVCDGGSVTLTGGGASSYSWNNSITDGSSFVPSSTTTYTVTGTATNGCTNTATTTVTVNANPTASISGDGSYCQGTTIPTWSGVGSSAGSGTISSYSWEVSGTSFGTNSTFQPPMIGPYDLIITNTNGCTNTTSKTLSMNSKPTAVITNNTSTTELTCNTTTISLTASGGNTYAWSNSTNTANNSVTTPATYTVTATDGNGCQDTESVTITQDISTPTAGITNNTGSTELTCSQTSISLTATGGGTYLWSDNTTTAANTVSSAATYTVTVTKSNGCTATSSVTITQDAGIPTAVITNNTGTSELTCSQTSISVTASGGSTYSWSNSLGTSATQSLTSAGTYTVTATSSNGCSDTETITITSNTTAPSASITNNTGTTELTCNTTAVSLTATGGSSYLWSDNTTTANNSPTSAGVYTVTVTGSNGCTSTSSVTLTQDISTPSAGITNNTSTTILTCNTTSISVTATGGGTYKWDNNSTTAARTLSSTGTYSVTVTKSNGCTDTESITITQDITDPTAGITNNDGVTEITCSQTSISLTATGGGTYAWSNSTNTANTSPTTAGTYTVTVTASNGCTDDASVTLTSNTTDPTASITNNTGTTELTCGTTSISVSATGGGTYTWDNSLGTSANQTLTSAGTYNVTVTASNGCTDDASVTLTSNTTAPTAGITNNTGTTTLTCTTTSISVTATGGGTYAWSNSLGTNATQSLTSAGKYFVTVTSSNGCTDVESITLASNTTAPTAGITNNTGSSVITCTTTSISVTATGGGTYSWDNSLGSNASQTLSSAATYNVTVTASNGCTDDASLTITSNTTAPTVTANSTSSSICDGGSVTLTGGGANTYSWDNSVTDGQAFTPGSTTTYTVTGTNTTNGCTNTAQTTVTVNDNPTATPTASPSTIANGSSSSLTAGASGGSGSYTYSWDNGGTLSSTTVANPTATPTTNTTYSVTVTDANGCKGNGSVAVNVSSGTATWVGGTSTDWNTASNWDVGVVPTISTNVIIPSGANNKPQIATNTNAYAKNLTVQSGAVLVVKNTTSSSTKLTVAGDITLNGTLTQLGNANILLTGGSKTFTVGGSATTKSGRFEIEGSYTLSGNLTATTLKIKMGAILITNASTVRLYNLTQIGKLTMTTGNLYIEGSTTTFNNAYFVEGTGTVHIGKISSTWSTTTNQTVTSGIEFYNLKLYTVSGYTLTMGTGIGDIIVNTVWFLNPNTAGGTITLGDHMIVNNNVNMQTSGNALTLRLNYRLFRNPNLYGTGTFTMGNDEDNKIDIYYPHPTILAIDGFGSITFYGTVSNMADGVVIPATYETLQVDEPGVTSTLGADITINGDVLLSEGTLAVGNNTLTVKGNWTVQPGATFNAGTGTVKFEGSSMQTLTSKGQNFNNVEVNNTNTPIAINVIDGMILGTSGVLKLTDGIIKTVGTAPFAKVVVKNVEPNAIVGSNGTPQGLTPSSYVWGNLKRHTKSSGYSGKQKYEFPIGIVPPSGGSSPRYYRTRVDFVGLQGVSHITARFVVGAHPAYTSEADFANENYTIPPTDSTQSFSLARMLGEGYWRIHPNQQPTSGKYDIVLYTGVFETSGSSGKTAPVKTDTSNTNVASWAIAGNLASDNSSNRQNSHGKIKSYNLTSFSDFGVGDGGGAALPIELLNFDAFMSGDKVTLTWTTATEINNDFFTVERTLDGINFEEVLETPGSGNSFTPITYIAEDDNPLPGTSYYRLKQTDYDGQFEYSSMVELHNDYISDMNLYEIMVANNTKVVLKYQLTNNVRYDLFVYDITGKVVKHDIIYAEEGPNEYILNVKGFESGTYFITLQNQYEVHSERFMVRR